MYPNQSQPTPPPQVPVDYLNQIAPPSPKRPFGLNGPKGWLIIGAALVLLIIIGVIILNIFLNAQRQPLRQLAARLEATTAIASEAQPNLKSSQLRSLNSSLSLSLTNTNRDLADTLSYAGVDVTSLSDSLKQDESAAPVQARLEDARLNAVYDQTYAREMAYKLQTLLSLLQQIYNATGNDRVKQLAESTYNNLQPTQAAFDAYTRQTD
jgi:hypothetical protein